MLNIKHVIELEEGRYSRGYDEIKDIVNDFAIVVLNGKQGFVNEKGLEIAFPKYDKVYDFEDGLAVVKLNGKFGLINTLGEEITPIKYDAIHPDPEIYECGLHPYGMVCVKLNDKFGFVDDNTGKEITKIKYDNFYLYNDDYQMAKVLLDWKVGYVNKHGEEYFPKYEIPTDVIGLGLYRVKLNGKFGLIDSKDNEILPAIYDDIYPDSGSPLFHVILGGKSAVLNYEFEEVIPFTDGYISRVTHIYKGVYYAVFSDPTDCIHKNGIIDGNGNVILPPIYEIINFIGCNKESKKSNFSGKFQVYLDGKSAIFNVSGKMLIPFKYEHLYEDESGLIIVKQGGKEGIIDKHGNELVKPKYKKIIISRDMKTYSAITNRGEKSFPIPSS